MVENLQLLLAVIEYVQVFSEFAAHRVYGEVGKWVIVGVIQISKYFTNCFSIPKRLNIFNCR